MSDQIARARALLRRHFGYGELRPVQERVLRTVLDGDDTLAVLPTGAGKSVCFQIPALVLGGLTVVVSPLISLMEDQVRAAAARGIPSARLNSALEPAERAAVWEGLRAGTLRLLYVSPERLEGLAPELRAAGIRPALLAIDEAHCIAEWGHDFRPSYRRLRAARYRLGDPLTVALTGSATPEVRADIIRSLGLGRRGGCAVHVASFDRRNLWFGVVRVATERERMNALLSLLGGTDRIAIVYAPTRGVCEALARALHDAGYLVAPYHAGLTKARRAATLGAFLESRLEVVVATSAFGMGIDKRDVRLVVHWSSPPTPESYYQEAGRAGRDGEFARCVLLWRDGDASLHRRQLAVTFPDRRLVERIWQGSAPPSVPANVRESAERLRRELTPGPGPVDWRPVERRRRHALARIAALEEYARGAGCRRRRLVGWFGEKLPRCAGCDRCGPPPSSPRAGPRSGDTAMAPEDAATQALVRALRRWRAGVAHGAGVPEALVLADVTLRNIAAARPTTRATLADVESVGPRTLAKFADELLAVVARGAPRG